MKLNLSLFTLFFFATMLASFAQGKSQKNCAAMTNLEQRMAEDPSLKIKMDAIEQHTQNFLKNAKSGKAGEETSALAAGQILTIPVYVHVLYNTAAQNISDAQVQSQIRILNEDFRKLNADAAKTPAEFAGRVADAQIQFVLSGITRKYTTKTSWGTRDDIKKSTRGGVNPITPSTHLNMWVGEIGGGILGYAQFPGGSLATDGVVIGPKYFGDTGTATAPFNKGRTATHEVGHWLNLRHIWGDATCGNDYVTDTPAASGPAYGCPAYPKVSCSTNNMTMNFMDYTDDACMYMFSTGQKDRMRAIFAAGGSRESFTTTPGVISSSSKSDVGAADVKAGKGCASHEVFQRMEAEDANFRANQAAIEAHTANFIKNAKSGKSGAETSALSAGQILTIPVYVHVLYNTAAQNISDAQIQSQIRILNEDFRKLNADVSKTPALFAGLASDIQIQFTLKGVTRKATNKTSWGTRDDIKKSTRGGVNPITPSTHLNMWVGEIGGGILGYAQFPGGSLATDGVVIGPKYFGDTGTATAPFNKGRTATHEVGHWLNLRHIWGDATCGNDYVADTPAASGPAYGCPAYPTTSCSTTNMTMNYMDYTDDACMYMFTTGQKDRMRAIFAAGGARESFTTTAGVITASDKASVETTSKEGHKCASHEIHARQVASNPGLAAKQAEIEEHTVNFIKNGGKAKDGSSTMALYSGQILTIPVYVHVIYNTAKTIENISDAQIQSQIAILNQDFRKTNADRTKVPTAFASLAADIQIQFTLKGITRKGSTRTSWGTNDDMKKSTMGGVNPISPTNTLNIWVCNIGGGILGYAQFPGGASATDGVVIGPNYFGNTGYVTAPFNKGRTATHEVGHWLNLRHIWGDANCGNDYVTDTPAAAGPASGCPAYPTTSCSTTNMTMNYMDYTDDACMYMFTTGQKNRMRALFAAGGVREAFTFNTGAISGASMNFEAAAEDKMSASTSFEVYPNPASSEATVNLNFGNETSDVTISVSDIQGKVMQSEKVDVSSGAVSHKLNVAGLRAGVYMVTVNGKDFKQVKRLVIQ